MNSRQQLKIAKDLYKKSLVTGSLNNQKISVILKNLVSQKPQGLIGILKAYKKLVESKLNSETLLVETPTPITGSKKTIEIFKKSTGAKNIKVLINPNLVFGAKITSGDWVWENTLLTKLKQLTM